jgi:ribosome-associated protein
MKVLILQPDQSTLAKSTCKEEHIATNKITSQVNKLRRLIEKSLDADKAQDIVAIDLAGKSSLADFMIVASGTSQKHIATLAGHIAEKLHATGRDSVPIEGKDSSDWIVVDAGDIIVHIFRPEARRHYNLEKMWAMPMPAMEVAL